MRKALLRQLMNTFNRTTATLIFWNTTACQSTMALLALAAEGIRKDQVKTRTNGTWIS